MKPESLDLRPDFGNPRIKSPDADRRVYGPLICSLDHAVECGDFLLACMPLKFGHITMHRYTSLVTRPLPIITSLSNLESQKVNILALFAFPRVINTPSKICLRLSCKSCPIPKTTKQLHARSLLPSKPRCLWKRIDMHIRDRI